MRTVWNQGAPSTSIPPIKEAAFERAVRLRKTMTPPERRLWSRLRAGRATGLKFRRQQVIGPYIADFYCHAARLVVEVDGARHDARGPSDQRGDAWMQREGLRVMRIPAYLVVRDPDRVAASVMERAQELVRASQSTENP
ncbi:MAG: DUF559 domain-containing protein [Phycisphaeraceae bacterium]|nr:MAG: DUF559 domain-containing protein [Phycisphaeraceae bacterium]